MRFSVIRAVKRGRFKRKSRLALSISGVHRIICSGIGCQLSALLHSTSLSLSLSLSLSRSFLHSSALFALRQSAEIQSKSRFTLACDKGCFVPGRDGGAREKGGRESMRIRGKGRAAREKERAIPNSG